MLLLLYHYYTGRQKAKMIQLGNAQYPLDTFPRNVSVDGEVAKVANLLPTFCKKSLQWNLRNDTTQWTFVRANLLQTCCGLVVYAADLLQTC